MDYMAANLAIIVAALLHTQAQTPAYYYEKASDTPHLYQYDPAGHYKLDGKYYCAPTSAANAIVYLSRHGFPSLLASNTMEAAYSLVQKLASSNYIGTEDSDRTTDTTLMLGVARYLGDCGVKFKAFNYEGFRPLYGQLAGRDLAPSVSLDWIRQEIAKPNTVVWLHLGYYSASGGSTYQRFDGHFINAVGYGSDDADTNPNTFIIRNPALKNRTPSTGSSDFKMQLPFDEVTLKPSTPANLTGKYKGLPRSSAGLFQISGPALKIPKKAAFVLVDGAIALEL
jgi:hypothetical protein